MQKLSEIYPEIAASQAVMMCGISGSGKTVFSRRLEKEGFIRISADEIIWREYGNGFSALPFPRKKEIFRTVDSIIASELIRHITLGNKVVVDSTMCKRFKRYNIKSVCRELNINPVFVYLQASLPLLRTRLASRTGRGPNDQIITDVQLENFYSGFEAPDPDENFIVISQTSD